MAGRRTFDPGGYLPALLQIETRRLKVERGQHRAGPAAPPSFFLCHREDPATKSVAPQVFGQEKSLDRQQAERRAAQ